MPYLERLEKNVTAQVETKGPGKKACVGGVRPPHAFFPDFSLDS
jgi:hypothetical protein